MNPRLAAWRVLVSLETTPRHLEGLLQDELAQHEQAQPRDRAQAANLVYTVLRHRLLLDYRLAPLLKRPLDKLDREVLAWLRLGAAELTVLGTPAHAAVHATVQAAKRTPAARAQGLINGVLRALDRSPVRNPSPKGDPYRWLSLTYSHPAWLVKRLCKLLGRKETEAWLAAAQEPAPPALRVNTLKTSRADLAEMLAPHCRAVEAHPLSPEALVLQGATGPLTSLPGFSQGLWQAQDPGSQLMAHLLAPRPGMRVADLCAGSGGKTGHLAALMENQGEILAVDTSASRLDALEQNLARLRVSIARTLKADAAGLARDAGPFDRILVDAPCTGLGTLGRRPDIRWRVGPEDPARLATVQEALLERAAGLLAPGGALLYCTCTVTPEENQEVVSRILERRPELALNWGETPPPVEPDPDGCLRILAHRHRSDSFFAARLVSTPS